MFQSFTERYRVAKGTICPAAPGLCQLVSGRSNEQGHDGNQATSLLGDRGPELVENLGTSHVLGTIHWHSCVHRRTGSGGLLQLCLVGGPLAFERSGQVCLLSDCRVAGFIAEGDA